MHLRPTILGLHDSAYMTQQQSRAKRIASQMERRSALGEHRIAKRSEGCESPCRRSNRRDTRLSLVLCQFKAAPGRVEAA